MAANSQPLYINSSYYDTDYYKKHIKRIVKNDRFTRVKTKRLYRLLQPAKGEIIADLGCGAGTMMITLADSQAKIIGIDFSAQSLRISKEQFTAAVPDGIFRGVCSDAAAVALKSSSLNAVMAVDFTEHIDYSTLDSVIKEVYRVLVVGGRFVIYTPNIDHIIERMKRHNIIFKTDPSHIGLRPLQTYLTILRKNGFWVAQSYFEPTHIPFVSQLETLLMKLPFIGKLARRRICILAVKSVPSN